MAVYLFANNASTTVSSGGTDAPAAGTSETWTVASSAEFPSASASVTPATVFAVQDPAAPTEIMLVTNVSSTTWTVTRGAEGTTPVTHAANFVVNQVATADGMGDATSIQGVPVASTPPTSGQVQLYDGTSWAPTTPATVTTTLTPTPDTSGGAPGTNATASSSNHSHPLTKLYNAMQFGFPPAYPNTFAFDGTTGTNTDGTINNYPYGWFGTGNYQFATLSGSVYTVNQSLIFAQTISLAAGYTVEAGPANGNFITWVASESITINGTIEVLGGPASGATGGAGTTTTNNGYQGGAGATGGTGAGVAGTGDENDAVWLGGEGGNGGASGSVAGGSALGGPIGTVFYTPSDLLWLRGSPKGMFQYAQAPVAPMGGAGGASGAGDGTNDGGGGGGGGGILLLIAPTIVLGANAILNASGGAGAAGVAGNAGGGGGGGGGFVSLQALSLTIPTTAQILTAGGAGGAGAGTGTAGAAGSTSTAYFDPPTADGGYGYGGGCLICQWQ